MAAFLLWNVNKNKNSSVDGHVQNLVREHQIDVALLVEYDIQSSLLTDFLRTDGLFRRMSPIRFGVFVRENHRLVRLRHRLGKRVGLWKWVPPSGQDGLIVLIHGLDRRNHDEGTRRAFFHQIVQSVQSREHKQNHRRTIIAGDFNAQPFESAVVDSDGLHAIGVRTVRGETSRRVQSLRGTADFFYNPMWRLYGHRDHPDAGAATYHWTKDWAHDLGWFMLDQVVLRPEESPRFPEGQLRIVTRVGKISLLDLRGLPDSQTISDHLPIIFHWDL